MKKILLQVLTISLLSLIPAHSVETVRAAIDFGSGAIKIQVAVVETETSNIVGKPLLATYQPLMLTEDVANHEGHISPEMASKALEILQGFKESAQQIAGDRPVHFTAIATAVFRKAKNGADLLQLLEGQLGIPFQILSQEEEGKLGLMTAKALFPEVENLVAWDSGNGSFQMTTDDAVYLGPLGHGTVRVLLSKEVRQGAVLKAFESGNPILPDEAAQLKQKIIALLPATPEWLASPDRFVATFGDGESIFYLVAKACNKEERITQADVRNILKEFLGKDDATLSGIHYKTVTSAILLSTIMDHFGIAEIHYKRTVGSTSGMLVSEALWQ